MITKSIITTYIENPHLFGHYLGYKDLIPIHSEWIKDAWLKKDKKSMQAHRNSYKTTSILIVGVIWYLLFYDQDCTNLIIRKAETDAQRIIRTVKSHLESNKILLLVNHIFKVDTLKTQNWSNTSITLSIKRDKTPEGSLDAKGTTSSITGAHYDNIFPDDIITLKDRVSKAEREWTSEFIRELRNILKEGGNLYFSGTPWHKDDGWKIIPKPDIYPIGTVQIKGYTSDKIENKIAELKGGTTRSLYCANYDLKHIDDEDKIFTEPMRKVWPESIQSISAWLDPAYSGKNTNALTMICKSNDEWFVRGWVWPGNIVDIYDEIVDKMTMYSAGTLFVESNADKGLSIKDLRQKYHSVTPKWEKQNKHIKIISYARQHWNKLIFAHDCQDEYLNQILDYVEKEEPDDAPDSLAALMREVGFSGSNELTAPKFKRHNVIGW